MEPAPFPPQQKSEGSYFVGLAIGFIPLILFLIGFGASTLSSNLSVIFGNLLFAALLLYPVLFIAAIVCLCIRSVRFVGYGLLTAFLVTPVVAYIGCIAIINRPR